MMKIMKSKIDNRGRIILPKYFLKANDIRTGDMVEISPMQGTSDSVKLTFIMVEDDE